MAAGGLAATIAAIACEIVPVAMICGVLTWIMWSGAKSQDSLHRKYKGATLLQAAGGDGPPYFVINVEIDDDSKCDGREEGFESLDDAETELRLRAEFCDGLVVVHDLMTRAPTRWGYRIYGLSQQDELVEITDP